MDLKRIRHFVVLAETLNFRKAAERLNMTQPPLSVSIEKLERELGATLFDRDTGGVRLTSTGREPLVEAKRFLFQGERVIDVARRAADGTCGELRVGFVGSATYGLLQRLVTRYRGEFRMYSASGAAGLHGAATLACPERGFIPRVTQEATQIQTVLSLVESGLGVALVPSVMHRFVSQKLVYRALSDLPASATVGFALCWRKDMEAPVARNSRTLAVSEFGGTHQRKRR
jgi:DNA-binding transcriptional LysR family regulator